ncbi:hypothetical protein B0I72DRAFT_141736 [Yarrowia lipolytica]|uniref:YALI0E22396p n=2 Tax=Yarrowia lipolytica TaxID=4952 RepID=Q6C4Z6_YARLI|nr:YALI0E22396p [Yarrowia lipolytica CLIB122]AOW05790.1 hypothetical protein YALI1_E26433g [Yarrowia lipolytica]KAB8285990.1 hypothetical protein BKA91DRAFT_132505 [Yarrowia lipolytica]KAE8172459.1 hypothetical protein BKA90DRAFT_137256 [Yarrowia lipolytica]KAJ8057240.1 hypothetical protein LXG23DRAFT_53942 [Yarrowia lipolytica]RDW25511.1 hypothetical protein B0I71DRAFT_132398 [Yarrowia lipolytica]|eukprot:XP_504266.1 YALI0E22396p [Yarrowia lipolytica CLIB122]
MVSTRIITVAALASAALAAPAPAPASNELVGRQLWNGIEDIDADVETVLSLVSGTVNVLIKPPGDRPTEIQVLTTTFNSLNAGVDKLLADLGKIPLVGSLVTIIAKIAANPVIHGLLLVVEDLVTLLVGGLVDYLVVPLVQAVDGLLKSVSDLLQLLGGLPGLTDLAALTGATDSVKSLLSAHPVSA